MIILALSTIGIVSFVKFKQYAKTVKDKHCIATQISSRIFDFNTFDIQISDELNITDFVITNKNSGKIICQTGTVQKGIKNEHGYCLFAIFYQGIKIYEIGHFKYNNWNTNDYILKIDYVESQINPTLILADKEIEKILFYKLFEYKKNGKLEKIVYMSNEKIIYSEKHIK